MEHLVYVTLETVITNRFHGAPGQTAHYLDLRFLVKKQKGLLALIVLLYFCSTFGVKGASFIYQLCLMVLVYVLCPF